VSTVVETASRASSRWCEGTIEVGRERRRYLLGLDIGTLDALVQQAEELSKLEASCESVVAKVGDALKNIGGAIVRGDGGRDCFEGVITVV
jgi:hypothetical protein